MFHTQIGGAIKVNSVSCPELPDNLPRRRAAEWRDVQQHPRLTFLFIASCKPERLYFALFSSGGMYFRKFF